MCEMLGSQPLEEEIPIEMGDFSEDIQLVFELYSILPDIWEGFSGSYLGKDYSNIFKLFDIYDFDRTDYLFYLRLIKHMDRIRSEVISQKIKLKQDLEKSSKK